MKAPSEEIYGKSTQKNAMLKRTFSGLLGYNAVADNTGLCSLA